MARRAVRVDDFPNRDLLDDIAFGIHKAAILKTALELEIFTRVAEGKRTMSALARSASLDERHARALLNALCFMGLLVKQQNEYQLTPTAEAFLVKGKLTYCGGAWLNDFAWDARGDIARALRANKPILASPLTDNNETTRAERAAATLADWEHQIEWANEAWNKIDLAREGKKSLRVLALGCESGIFAFALAKQFASARVTAMDRAMVLAYARQLAEKMNVLAQITFQARDIFDLSDVSETYDLILIENINQFASPEQNIGLFRKAYESLANDGRIILRTMVADDDLRSEVAIWAVEILLRSSDGDAFTFAEYRGMLEAAGFSLVTQLKDDWGLITAQKLAAAQTKKLK
ncbi:MAG: class I SAM-dependent methyltransferase [Chloroflexi bacterium]|nr:class I SAM-dependent methyltransferase [Chloroflexota bacterium]